MKPTLQSIKQEAHDKAFDAATRAYNQGLFALAPLEVRRPASKIFYKVLDQKYKEELDKQIAMLEDSKINEVLEQVKMFRDQHGHTLDAS